MKQNWEHLSHASIIQHLRSFHIMLFNNDAIDH